MTNLPWSAFALLALRPGFVRLWDERGRRLLQAKLYDYAVSMGYIKGTGKHEAGAGA